MRKVVRKSLRQTVADNQAALNFMSKLAGGDGHVNKIIIDPVKAKYGNKKSVIDGITFDSKKEASKYLELKMLVQKCVISDLELQKLFILIPSQKLSTGKTERACIYIADFCYKENGIKKVVDVKGMKSGSAYSMFVIKRKLMKHVHDIEIIEC